MKWVGSRGIFKEGDGQKHDRRILDRDRDSGLWIRFLGGVVGGGGGEGGGGGGRREVLRFCWRGWRRWSLLVSVKEDGNFRTRRRKGHRYLHTST